jgi:hypothetical protein
MRVAMARSGLAAAAFALGTLSGSVRGWTMPAVQRLLPGCTAVRARWVTASTRAPALPAARRPRPPLHVRALAAQAGGGDAQAHPPEFYADLVARRLREANPRAGGGRKRVLFVTGGCWRLRPTVPASLPLALALARPRAPSLSSSRTSLVSPLPRSLSSSNDLSLSHSISSSLPLTTRLPPFAFLAPARTRRLFVCVALSVTHIHVYMHPPIRSRIHDIRFNVHARKGAGMSAESGLPTYRGVSGLYNQVCVCVRHPRTRAHASMRARNGWADLASAGTGGVDQGGEVVGLAAARRPPPACHPW